MCLLKTLLFHVKYDSSIIVDFDRNEYFVNQWLKQTFYQRNSFQIKQAIPG
jgi:hypothetical protein